MDKQQFKVPKGWQIVPVKMTREMIEAHAPHDKFDRDNIRHDYAVSLQNAPKHPDFAELSEVPPEVDTSII